MMSQMEKDKKFYVAGHRGYRSHYPENTLLSFYEAIKIGCDMIEFDLRLSKDNVLMVIHDEKLDRTINATGLVADFTCEELQKFDAGIKFGKQFEGLKIPTFEELCEFIKPYPDLLINVEIKTAPNSIEATDAAVKMMEKYGYIDNCVINSFDANVIAHAYDKYGLKTHGFPPQLMKNFDHSENGTYSKMWTMGIDRKFLTPEYVKEVADRGIIPWSYNPNDDEAARFCLESGARLATCDNPEPTLRIAKEMGLR